MDLILNSNVDMILITSKVQAIRANVKIITPPPPHVLCFMALLHHSLIQ